MNMSEKKSRIQGTGKVYRFTIAQLMKSRTNRWTLLLLLIFALASVPLLSLTGQGSAGTGSASSFTVQVETLTAYENPELLSSDAKFVLQYGYSILVLMLITISSSYIIRSVVEEKASRLVEFLMVSVKPLALILGKILAVMTYIFVMFAVTAAGLVCSYIITARFMDVGAVGGLLEQAGLTSLEIGPQTVLITVVSLVLGYLTFSILAGLSGAACSNMEEVEGAATQVVILGLIGYMVPVIFGNTVSGTGAVLLALCPVVSVFSAPVQFVTEAVGLPILLASWGIQAAVICILSVFMAKVYGGLIMYRGRKLQMKDLLKKGGF